MKTTILATGVASFKAEHATLESLAAKKAKKSKGPFNRDNAWKRYDHKLDPQSFPEYAAHAPNCHAVERLDAQIAVQGPI